MAKKSPAQEPARNAPFDLLAVEPQAVDPRDSLSGPRKQDTREQDTANGLMVSDKVLAFTEANPGQLCSFSVPDEDSAVELRRIVTIANNHILAQRKAKVAGWEERRTIAVTIGENHFEGETGWLVEMRPTRKRASGVSKVQREVQEARDAQLYSIPEGEETGEEITPAQTG